MSAGPGTPWMEANDPPASALAESVVLGIDEAGRGPVLGPMVYACAYWAESLNGALSKAGFQDSKQLTEARRQALSDRAKAHGDVGYVILPLMPDFISASMLRRVPYSLNAMSHDAAIDLVREVQRRGVVVSHVFVDTVGDAGSYERKLTGVFKHTIKFTVTKKADSLFPVVSAASILAKVKRDAMLRSWVFTEPFFAERFPPPCQEGGVAAPPATHHPDDSDDGEGEGDPVATTAAKEVAIQHSSTQASKRRRVEDEDAGEGVEEDGGRAPRLTYPPFHKRLPGWKLHPHHAGSGYPGDALTKAWLRDTCEPVFGWPAVMRFSWGTAKELLKTMAVAVDWGEEDEDEGEEGRGGGGSSSRATPSTKLTAFFSNHQPRATMDLLRSPWAKARGMSAVMAGGI